ncbi:MAG: lytic transglycosylase domain-containing protein [Sphingobium sp.]|nr:lytic transglycosylase domain-containing protein [Sphingobium sp.]
MASALLALSTAEPAQARGRLSDPVGEAHVAQCIRWASDGKPWLEKTLWGLRDQEGGWIGAEVRNANGSHDLGPLQVNSWWVSKIAGVLDRPPDHVRYWLQFDTCFNVQAARWIFLSGLTVTRDYWKAIGVYHSPTGWRQRRYQASVVHHLRARFGDRVFVSAASPAQAMAAR